MRYGVEEHGRWDPKGRAAGERAANLGADEAVGAIWFERTCRR